MTPEPTRLQQVIVWLVMLVSIVMYCVVAKVVPPADPQPNPMIERIFMLVAVGLVGASFVIKKRIGAGAPPAARLIIPLALCEAAALFGVVVWFVTGWQYYYVFLVLGAAGQVLHYPGANEEV